MTNYPGTTICVFAKAPKAGQVKTRLAAVVGASLATQYARAFLLDSIALAAQLKPKRVILALSGDAADLPTVPQDIEIWSQGEGDLGERMERILRRALTDCSSALVIGTDSPGLPGSFLEQAIWRMTTCDAVLGPADDGGYYLLGLKTCPVGLLGNLPWSSSTTRLRTVERLRSFGLTVEFTERWFDVDVATDLVRLRTLIDEGGIVAPYTAAILALGDVRANAQS